MQEKDNNELSTKEAADILGLAQSTLRKWRCTNEQPGLPHYKRFSRVFYIESEVVLFKEESTVGTEETYI